MSILDLDWKLRNHNGRLVLAAADQVIVDPEEPEIPDVPTEPVLTIEQQLRAWLNSEAWTWTSINNFSDTPEVTATATVQWPDGVAGVYTALTYDALLKQWNSRKITHVASGKTITQAMKGRDSNGMVTGYNVTIS